MGRISWRSPGLVWGPLQLQDCKLRSTLKHEIIQGSQRIVDGPNPALAKGKVKVLL